MTHQQYEMQILRASRNRLLQILETIDKKILFEIPKGFNNNIVWQIGHCITSQQRHMYMRSGLAMHITEEFMENFKFGSSPIFWRVDPNIDEIKQLLIHTVDRLESDLKANIFVKYEPFELPIGIRISNHLQALQAAIYHEAEHSGNIFMYLKTLVRD